MGLEGIFRNRDGTKSKEDEEPLVLALSTLIGELNAIEPSIIHHFSQSNLSFSLFLSLQIQFAVPISW